MRSKGQQPLQAPFVQRTQAPHAVVILLFFGRLCNIQSGTMFAQLILVKETCCTE